MDKKKEHPPINTGQANHLRLDIEVGKDGLGEITPTIPVEEMMDKKLPYELPLRVFNSSSKAEADIYDASDDGGCEIAECTSDEIAQSIVFASNHLGEAVEALSGVMELIESGYLIRDIENDEHTHWATIQLKAISALQRATNFLIRIKETQDE